VAVAVPAPAAAEGLEKRAPASVENPPEPGQRADSAAADNLAATGTAPALAARAVSTAASFHANYLNNPAPAYPAAARRRRVEGTVLLEVTVGVDGRAREVRVNRSSGADDLDEAAMAAVRGWTFVPATRAGERIEGAVEVPVRFRLAASD
jgi:protein TonB